jgi:hypothetical protein
MEYIVFTHVTLADVFFFPLFVKLSVMTRQYILLYGRRTAMYNNMKRLSTLQLADNSSKQTVSTVFWYEYITPCSSLKVNWCFEGTCRFRLQGRRISQAGFACYLLLRWFHTCLILRPWRWRPHVSPKRRFNFSGLHGVISQKIELFISIDVRTWSPTQHSWVGCSDACTQRVINHCVWVF